MLKELKKIVAKLEAEQAAAEVIRPPRILSITARNVQYGDYVNFEGYGWCEVNGHTEYTNSGDVVLAAMGTGGAVHTFPCKQRLQVRRYV